MFHKEKFVVVKLHEVDGQLTLKFFKIICSEISFRSKSSITAVENSLSRSCNEWRPKSLGLRTHIENSNEITMLNQNPHKICAHGEFNCLS